ncbi:hypothetical protein KPH14_012759 [Odynerus spinipes]|uniref:Uncharacterized protein n=1 Tax=Odynerus spinipes TaxID=1348599 RepID=A0AAD9R8Z2_9HYME|nr:hypothetical protein KPH14_012759 [Odynerus spinipes]
MDRTKIEKFTTDQLREEASKYGLPTSENPDALLDAILTHWERYGQERQPPAREPPATTVTLGASLRGEGVQLVLRIEQVMAEQNRPSVATGTTDSTLLPPVGRIVDGRTRHNGVGVTDPGVCWPRRR